MESSRDTEKRGEAMKNPLLTLEGTIIVGLVLAVAMVVIVVGATGQGVPDAYNWLRFLFRWLHVVSGVMWIGLLWYFNFVQIPTMPKIPDELKPAVGKHIAPAALFWFRWGAMATIVTGLILAWMEGYVLQAIGLGLADGVAKHTAIGIGMWLGAIMWFNVWFVIWPNQKRALGIVQADADSKAKSARVAMLTSRTNTALSIPMLYAMVSAQNVY
jgi:uncharacterized membrane protein